MKKGLYGLKQAGRGCQYSVDQSPSWLNHISRMKGVLYSKAIGSVLWPVFVLRPNTAFAIGVLSQFIQNPGPAHWKSLKRVINYLGCTKNLWLTFGEQKKTLLKVSATRIGRDKNIDIRSLGFCSIMESVPCCGVPKNRI